MIYESRSDTNVDISLVQEQIKQLKKGLKKEKKENGKDSVEYKNKEKQYKELSNILKNTRQNGKKQLSEKFDKISLDIYTETAVNEDIADAIGVAIAFQKDGH